MTTREMIHAEVEKVAEEKLDELFDVVRSFRRGEAHSNCTSGVLGKLKRIRIQGPEDFAANLDLYLSGEKQIERGEDPR